MTKIGNQLAQETASYLLQHAANPVHWHAWNLAALQRARDEGRPILRSMSYATCHCCQVMEHESCEAPWIVYCDISKTASKPAMAGHACAYVRSGGTCRPPITELQDSQHISRCACEKKPAAVQRARFC
jgi:hypothetical protein